MTSGDSEVQLWTYCPPSVPLVQETTVLGAGLGWKPHLDATVGLFMQHCTPASGRVRERLGTDLRAAIDHAKNLPEQFAGMRGELMAVFKGYYM